MSGPDLMPHWPGTSRRWGNRGVRRIRNGLAKRGYQTPVPFRRELSGIRPYAYDALDEGEDAYTWAWEVPYCRPGEYTLDRYGEPDTVTMPLLRGPSVEAILDDIERLP